LGKGVGKQRRFRRKLHSLKRVSPQNFILIKSTCFFDLLGELLDFCVNALLHGLQDGAEVACETDEG